MEKGERAVEIFDLVKQKGMLPTKLSDLVPLSFIGQQAVNFYRGKIKLMEQLKMTEEQRKVTLRDGQQAGEMLLDIEARIGELAEKEETAVTRHIGGNMMGGKYKSLGKPPKHERMGLSHTRLQHAQAISKHPEVVERVKAQAKANEDIPTRTAVINEIRNEQIKKEKKEKIDSPTFYLKGKALIYQNALLGVIKDLPAKPPSELVEKDFEVLKSLAKVIVARLAVFVTEEEFKKLRKERLNGKK